MQNPFGALDALPRVRLGIAPTPLERMRNLENASGGDTPGLYVKRDDCTGLAFGGNKVRQLEFYLGEAAALGCDTVLITGAVQSNFVRLAAAAAAVLGMKCHIQLEERVAREDPLYRNSGNVLLDRLLGATLHSYPEGEDEDGADRRLGEIAENLKNEGRTPYIVPLAPGHPPLGALGYIVAAREIMAQTADMDIRFDEIIVASGSGNTHAGLLFGLRALGARCRVTGACVRRGAELQTLRIKAHCRQIARLLDMENPVADKDIILDDEFLAPGYGTLNAGVANAIRLSAQKEGLILDPVYTGRSMAAVLERARKLEAEQNMLLIHTGGTPAVFAYGDDLL